jgi:Flp pilus assembly protein TadD
MFRTVLAASCLLGAVPALAQGQEFALQGRITTDRPSASIRLVLEDPRARNAEAARAMTDENGNYMIRGLGKREYRLVVYIDEKRQDRRNVEILCHPGSTATKDFHFGKSRSTLILNFPAEDPDIVDIAELQGDYPKEVFREYEKAREDQINGKTARAIERYEAVVSRAPGFYRAHARLGVLYQQEGCFSDAEVEYLRASTLSPRSPQPLLNLASVQIRAADLPGDFDTMLARAKDTLAKALDVRPTSAIAHCLLGAAHLKLHKLDDAEESFKRALDLDVGLEAARLMLAKLYLDQELWDAGIENLRIYLENFPSSRDRSVVKEMLETAELKARENARSDTATP